MRAVVSTPPQRENRNYLISSNAAGSEVLAHRETQRPSIDARVDRRGVTVEAVEARRGLEPERGVDLGARVQEEQRGPEEAERADLARDLDAGRGAEAAARVVVLVGDHLRDAAARVRRPVRRQRLEHLEIEAEDREAAEAAGATARHRAARGDGGVAGVRGERADLAARVALDRDVAEAPADAAADVDAGRVAHRLRELAAVAAAADALEEIEAVGGGRRGEGRHDQGGEGEATNHGPTYEQPR